MSVKKLTANLLTICMLLSLLPMSAFAAPGGESADTIPHYDPSVKCMLLQFLITF